MAGQGTTLNLAYAIYFPDSGKARKGERITQFDGREQDEKGKEGRNRREDHTATDDNEMFCVL